jgi:hypothetical protein
LKYITSHLADHFQKFYLCLYFNKDLDLFGTTYSITMTTISLSKASKDSSSVLGKRKREALEGIAEVEADLRQAARQQRASVPNPDDATIFTKDTCYCTRCHQMLPVSSFYPSNLRRSVYYCKICCQAQKKTKLNDRTNRFLDVIQKTDLDPPPRPSTDVAERMLNRLRRMCARPNKGSFKLLLLNPVRLGFGIRMARQLLAFWNNQSALPDNTATSTNDKLQRLALRWIPWNKTDTAPLQPWEVIPVTRQQARRLCAIPLHLWPDCLQPAVINEIEERVSRLKVLTGPEQVHAEASSLN